MNWLEFFGSLLVWPEQSTSMNTEALPEDLYAAIGRVAAASARLEEALRDVGVRLALSESDHGYVIFEGQSMDWLALACIALVDSRLSVPSFESRNPTGFAHLQALRGQLKGIETIRNDRNIIVHGNWSTVCPFDGEEDASERCTPRSSGARSEQVFHVSRSRHRQPWPQEQAWTVTDVLAVATAFDDRASMILATHSAYRQHWLAHPPGR